MSLSELLGDSESSTAPTDTSADEPLDDGSGLINLAQMVQAAQPAAPPNPVSQSYPGAPATDTVPPAQTTGGYPTAQTNTSYDQGSYNDVPTPKKSNKLPIIVISIVLIVGGAVGAFVAFRSGGENDADEKLAALEASLADAVAKAEAEGDATQKAELEKQLAAENAEDADQAENGDNEEDFEFAEEEVDDGKGGKKRRRVKRYKRRSKSSKASTAPAVSAADAPNTAPKKSSKTSAKTSELDSLLASKGSAEKAGGLPDKPTRAQVNSSMRSVVSKAKNVCGKSGSGKVNVRIIVGSNGVVRDAIPTGAHSADSLGRCVATIARRTARLPKFKSPTFTFTYPFNI